MYVLKNQDNLTLKKMLLSENPWLCDHDFLEIRFEVIINLNRIRFPISNIIISTAFCFVFSILFQSKQFPLKS